MQARYNYSGFNVPANSQTIKEKMKNKSLSPEHKDSQRRIYTLQIIYIVCQHRAGCGFHETPARPTYLDSIVTIFMKCRSSPRRSNTTRINGALPGKDEFHAESVATSCVLVCWGMCSQLEIAAGVVEWIYEASEKKNDAPQGDSAANAADPAGGLPGCSGWGHKDAFSKICSKIFLTAGLAPFPRLVKIRF